jgi:TerF-like vWA domain-containing protein
MFKKLFGGADERTFSRISMRKEKAGVVLEKKGILDTTSKVALVLDASGSMDALYANGTVQDTVERILGVAMNLDDDGKLDVWFFADDYKKVSSATARNAAGYVDAHHPGESEIGVANDEPKVMRDVVREYKNSQTPAFVVFISDGGVHQNAAIEAAVRESVDYPIFWMFVGVGNANFGILEHLDDLEGRRVDNADFFSLSDLKMISDDELYERLLGEYPSWLRDAAAAGILQD